MKNKPIILSILLISTIFVFGYSKFNTIKSYINKNSVMNQDPEVEILGFWILENDPSTKIEFTDNGHLKTYIDNQLESTDLYEISSSCDRQTLPNNSKFLKTIDSSDNSVFCSIINGINENNSNILSLTTSNQGKVIIYIRQ